MIVSQDFRPGLRIRIPERNSDPDPTFDFEDYVFYCLKNWFTYVIILRFVLFVKIFNLRREKKVAWSWSELAQFSLRTQIYSDPEHHKLK